MLLAPGAQMIDISVFCSNSRSHKPRCMSCCRPSGPKESSFTEYISLCILASGVQVLTIPREMEQHLHGRCDTSIVSVRSSLLSRACGLRLHVLDSLLARPSVGFATIAVLELDQTMVQPAG